MAKLVEEYPSQHDVRGAHKLPSFRVAGGRLVVDNYRGVLRVRFFSEVGHPFVMVSSAIRWTGSGQCARFGR
jgi:hypothetical protein